MTESLLSPENLDDVTFEALGAYELAKTTLMQTRERLNAAHDENLADLRIAEEVAVAEAQIEHQQTMNQIEAWQRRIGQVAARAQTVETNARNLLQNVGLVQIIGNLPGPQTDLAELAQDSVTPATEADMATTFVETQTLYIDLRTALYELAHTLLAEKRWEEARLTAEALMADNHLPLHDAAFTVVCESFYQQAQQAMANQQWRDARQHLQTLLEIAPNYRDAANLRKQTYSAWRIVRQIPGLK